MRYGKLMGMVPVLFSIGNISASSFGIFLILGFIFGVFLVWRLCRAWDINEEKALDLMLLTLIGGLLGARIYFAIENFQLFSSSPLNLILINKVPGFNFWGGFLGGWLALYFFVRRFKINFWQVADIALVGFIGGLIFSDIGCLLGSCNVGIPSKAFFAVTQQGLVERRWPVQAVEAILLSFALVRIWSQATHFHQRGKIVSQGFIYIGIIRLMLEPLKQDHSGAIFSLVLAILGITIYYLTTKQSPIKHLQQAGKFVIDLITDREFRNKVVQILIKSWYNQKTILFWKLKNWKKLLRRFNVKFS